MTEWQLLLLAVQSALLVVGWLLFLQAKTELTARAANAPVVTELRSLKQGVQALVRELDQASVEASARLQVQCDEARRLIERLDTAQMTCVPGRKPPGTTQEHSLTAGKTPSAPLASLRDTIAALRVQGEDPDTIAGRLRLSKGEVETILALLPRSAAD